MQGGPPGLMQDGPPSAGAIIEMCDADSSGGLTIEEAHKCIDDNAPPEMRKEAHDMVNKSFAHADKDGNGELTKKELEAAMGGPPSLAQDGPPSPKELMGMCDTDKSGGITKAEAHKCIDAHAPPEMRDDLHAMVDAGFKDADKNGNGELSIKELEATMGGPPSLA